MKKLKIKKRKSFQSLCYEYKGLNELSEKINGRLGEISDALSFLSKELKRLLAPEEKVFHPHLGRGVDKKKLIKVTRVLDLRKRAWVTYRETIDLSSDVYTDEGVAPVGIGGFERDVVDYPGEVIRVEPASDDLITLIKALRRKVKRLRRVLQVLRKERSKVREQVERIVREVGRRIFGGPLDEGEYEVARSYIEEALEKQIFDLEFLVSQHASQAKDAWEAFWDRIFGAVK
ncbi:MAG: hypothetical protein QXX30_04710 [Candidatus Aenigmatarchaeota archaeon]